MKPTTEENPHPTAEWATWALLNLALHPGDDNHPDRPKALQLCAERLAALVGENPNLPVAIGPRCILLMTDGGHWARASGIDEAAGKLIGHGARRSERVKVAYVVNGEPHVDRYGNVSIDGAASIFWVGWVGTVGSIRNANNR